MSDARTPPPKFLDYAPVALAFGTTEVELLAREIGLPLLAKFRAQYERADAAPVYTGDSFDTFRTVSNAPHRRPVPRALQAQSRSPSPPPFRRAAAAAATTHTTPPPLRDRERDRSPTHIQHSLGQAPPVHYVPGFTAPVHFQDLGDWSRTSRHPAAAAYGAGGGDALIGADRFGDPLRSLRLAGSAANQRYAARSPLDPMRDPRSFAPPANSLSLIPLVQLVNWPFSTEPDDEDLPPERYVQLKRLEEVTRRYDAIFQFAQKVAGAGRRALDTADLVNTGDSSGRAVETVFQTVRSFSQSVIKARDINRDLSAALASAASALNTTSAATAAAASSTASASTPGVSAGTAAAALSAGAANTFASQLLAMLGSPSFVPGAPMSAAADPNAGLPRWLADKGDDLSVDDVSMWLISRKEPLEATKLKLWQQLMNGGTNPSNANIDALSKQIDFGNKLRRFMRMQDAEFAESVETMGSIVLKSDLWWAILSAGDEVRRVSGRGEVSDIQLMTHQNVSTQFAELVVDVMFCADANNPSRPTTMGARNAVHTARQLLLGRFAGLDWMAGPPPLGRQLVLRKIAFDERTGSMRKQPVPSFAQQLERERGQAQAHSYAQRTGSYYTGASNSMLGPMQRANRDSLADEGLRMMAGRGRRGPF